ncbi:MAG: hypothetical protein HY423_16065 [Candidatus Lambdaproteobacteria bacterium]|nr:hypothetical protein [Candidatus Lambdaproteobacteria bacterium]
MSIFGRAAVVAAVVMMVLGLALTASAQEEKSKGPQFRGDFQTSFGQLSTSSSGDGAAFVTGSELFSGLESNMYWSGGSGALTTDARWRIRGVDRTLWGATHTGTTGTKARSGPTNDPDLNDVSAYGFSALRLWVNWRPVENLRIQVGRLTSVDIPGSFFSDIDAGQQPIRVQDGLVLGENGDGIDVTYKMGALTAGVALFANCAGSTACDGGLTGATTTYAKSATSNTVTATTNNGGTLYNDQTLMPHVGFSQGPIKFSARYVMASGTVATAAAGVKGQPTAASTVTNSVSSSMLHAGGSFAMGFGSVSLDYQTWTRNIKLTGESDRERAVLGLALRTKMGVEAMYVTDSNVTVKNTTGEAKQDLAVIQVQYLMKVGQGSWGPVFAQETVDFKDGATVTNGSKDYTLSAQTIGVVFKTAY